MIELNKWLPVDASKPIPNPENDRQVLCIYRPSNDTNHNKAHGLGPFSKGPADYSITCDPDADHDRYLYWNHGWMRNLSDGKGPLIYDTKYMSGLLYCITEFPPLPATSGTSEEV